MKTTALSVWMLAQVRRIKCRLILFTLSLRPYMPPLQLQSLANQSAIVKKTKCVFASGEMEDVNALTVSPA